MRSVQSPLILFPQKLEHRSFGQKGGCRRKPERPQDLIGGVRFSRFSVRLVRWGGAGPQPCAQRVVVIEPEVRVESKEIRFLDKDQTGPHRWTRTLRTRGSEDTSSCRGRGRVPGKV